MKIVVFHGSPRKGNTYKATQLFMSELASLGEVNFQEFLLPRSLPVFCTGCQLCLGNPFEKCPHSEYVKPIYDGIMSADALIFATPHFGACDMSGGMKNLLDHLDFLTLTVSPRKAIFRKKAFIITTATGSTAAIKPIKKYLKNWGVNRVESYGIRMFTDKWEKMPSWQQTYFNFRLKIKAKRFFRLGIMPPYLSTIFMYHMSRFILKLFVGKDEYPYRYWEKQGYFSKRPF